MELWQEIWTGVREEFSDLPGTREVTRLVVRSLLASVLGGLIGFERERSGKAAGIRTHMLVCIGTAFFLAIPQQSGMEPEELSRVIQGITAGIGFLGTGAILKHQQEGKIEGLTTAASVWFTAAIGIAVGLGRETSAVLGTVLALIILYLIPQPGQAATPAPGSSSEGLPAFSGDAECGKLRPPPGEPAQGSRGQNE